MLADCGRGRANSRCFLNLEPVSLPETPANPETPGRRDFAAKTALLSAATLFSRVLGLVREQLLAITLGASAQAEAFLIAYRIPNLLRDLFAEGALSAAFIPVFARADRVGAEGAFDLARRVLTLLALVLTFICAAGAIGAPWIVAGLASGFEAVEGKTELAIALTRVMMPILPFVSFAAVAMGMLNARDRFGLPSLAPAIFNVVNIAVATLLYFAGLPRDTVAYGWAVGALLGSLGQFIVQWPGLRGEGFRYWPDFSFADPRIREILATMAPATIGLAAVQINIFVSSAYASTEPGAVAWLGYAFRLLYLPMGLFGVAVGTVAGARLSRMLASDQHDLAHAQMTQALRLLAFLTLPSALGLIVAGRPIVRLIYEHGAFKAGDTEATALALAWMSVGLVAYASTKVFVPYFYAVARPRIPLAASLLAVSVNVATLVTLFPRVGFVAAGLAMALGNLANGGLLLVKYRGPRPLREQLTPAFIGGLVAAGAAMCAVVLGVLRVLGEPAGLGGKMAGALVPVALGALTYFAVASALRVPEASRLVRLVSDRFRR